MSDRAPCAKCGRLIYLGEARVGVQFTVDELVTLAIATTSSTLRARLLCAASLLDPDAAAAIEAAMATE